MAETAPARAVESAPVRDVPPPGDVARTQRTTERLVALAASVERERVHRYYATGGRGPVPVSVTSPMGLDGLRMDHYAHVAAWRAGAY